MKIIQINASYKPAYIYGGPTMSVSRLCEELVKAGVDSEVLTTTANGETELKVIVGRKVKIDGVPVTYFRRITKGNSHFSPALLFSLWSELKTNSKSRAYNENTLHKTPKSAISTTSVNQIEKFPSLPSTTVIVHIHAWWNLVSVGSTLIALSLSKKVILSPRGTLSNYSFGNRTSILKNIFHQILGKTILKLCHFHVSSEKEKQDILNIIQPKSITIVSNFVTLNPASQVFEVCESKLQATPFNSELTYHESRSLKILFLSRVEEKKGLDVLFNALHKIEINYHLTIAGTGELKYIEFLKSLATTLGIADRVSWIGQQTNKLKFSALSDHDLMVLPSHDESFANVVIESLSVGTPVLISSKVGLADYVRTNNFGWEYKSTADELAEALKFAFEDTERRKTISVTAPQKIALDFNGQHLLKQYLKLYQNIAEHV